MDRHWGFHFLRLFINESRSASTKPPKWEWRTPGCCLKQQHRHHVVELQQQTTSLLLQIQGRYLSIKYGDQRKKFKNFFSTNNMVPHLAFTQCCVNWFPKTNPLLMLQHGSGSIIMGELFLSQENIYSQLKSLFIAGLQHKKFPQEHQRRHKNHPHFFFLHTF